MRKLYLLASGTLLSISVNAQIVTKYSGIPYVYTGAEDPKYTGTRPNALDSEYYFNPVGIDADTSGKLYVTNEHNIFLLYSGKSKLVGGYNLDPVMGADYKNGTGPSSRYSSPAGIAVDPQTNYMIIADLGNNLIRSISPFQNMFTDPSSAHVAGVKLLNGSWADGPVASAKFNAPSGVAVNTNGDIYIADRDNHCIRKISGGNVTTIAGSAGVSGSTDANGGSARFLTPFNVYLENSNSLLVADFGNKRIRRINLTTKDVTTVVSTGLDGPTDLCMYKGNIYITDGFNVKVYNGASVSVYAGSATTPGNTDGVGTAARFQYLTGIVYSPYDLNFYVVDQGNNVIKRINPSSAPVVNFTASSVNITVGQNIKLKNKSANNPTQFRWSITPANYTLQNNSKLSDSIINISFNNTGSYNIKLWAANGAGQDSMLKSSYIIVSSSTAAPVVDFEADKTTLTISENASFSDLSTNAPNNWKWRFMPATVTYMNGTDSTSRFPVVRFNATGKYQVTLIAGNGTGSSSNTKNDYITVSYNASLKQVNNLNVTVYPNPTTGQLSFNSNGEEQFNVSIYSTDGRIVYAAENISVADISDKPKGLYIVKISNSKGMSSTRKIILE